MLTELDMNCRGSRVTKRFRSTLAGSDGIFADHKPTAADLCARRTVKRAVAANPDFAFIRSIPFSGKRLIGCLFVFLRGQWVMAETTLSSDTLLTLETAKEGGRLSADSVE